MSVCRKLPDGTIQKIAGHTILLDANASEIREGDFTIPVVPSMSAADVQITFTDPMPDTDYAVVLSDVASSTSAVTGEVHNKQTTGFLVQIGRPYSLGPSESGTGHYIAWKPVKIEGYTALQNKVNNPDSAPTEDSLNLITSGGVYDAIKDGGRIWRGTQAEWDAISATDKDFYDQAEISGVNNDGMVYVADKIESGNMNAVTSNAVHNAIGKVSSMTVTKQGNYINGTNFHGSKVGKVATIEINGDTGASIPWEQITTVGVATGCATPLTELKCTADMLSVTTGYDSNGNAITKWIPPYCRAWIGTNGEIQVFLANPGASDTSYTGNLFVGGSYITR